MCIDFRLDADMLAGEMPTEHEALKAEFAQHEAILGELEAQAASYRSQGNATAADRLDTQIGLLKKHLAEVSARFSKWQRPVDFEPKLQSVKRTLDEIRERLHLIELRSDDPQAIRDQLDHCMVSRGSG